MTSVVPRAHSRLTTLVVGLLVFLPFFQLHSQDLRASLTGLVADSTGAVIPNATVTATNINTQVASSTQTNAAGSYVLLFLIPGPYRVQVEAEGFKKLVRESVVLSTSERGTLDIALEVGQVTETISVSDAAPLLETATASRINAVTGQQVTDLPSQGRSIFNQLLALPGVQKQDRRWGAFSNYGLVLLCHKMKYTGIVCHSPCLSVFRAAEALCCLRGALNTCRRSCRSRPAIEELLHRLAA